jgi:tetratricopeptide (TPR) repeat protein
LKIIQLLLLLAAFSLAVASCNKKENPAARHSVVQPTLAPKADSSPPAQSAPVQIPVNYESDALYQQAQSLFHSDIRKAMDLLEAAIAKAPDAAQSAPYYLLLGKLKKEFEDCQAADTSIENSKTQCEGFVQYAKARSSEYFYNEVGGDYLYGGFHFQELEKRFPSSALAVEAAYERTKLSHGGECEGFVDCYIEDAFAPVRDFLLRYPDSPHTAEAVKRADGAFRKMLWGDTWKTEWTEIKDPNKATDYYDPNNLKKLVQDYEDLAEKLPLRFRATALETVAYYRSKFGEKDRTRALYQRILQENPAYDGNAEIRKQLAALN